MLTISGANWFGRRGRTCRLHAIYEPTVHLCGQSGRNCQVRLGAPSSPGDSRSHASNADLVLPVQYAHQAAPSPPRHNIGNLPIVPRIFLAQSSDCDVVDCCRRGSLWQASGVPPRSKPCSWSAYASSRSFAPFRPREAALAFRVTTTTSKPTCLLRRPQHTQ